MDKIINIVNNGVESKVYLLCAFLIDSVKCIIYTKGEKDYNNNMIIYVAKVDNIDNKQYISNVDFDIKEKVKDILKIMIKYNTEVR